MNWIKHKTTSYDDGGVREKARELAEELNNSTQKIRHSRNGHTAENCYMGDECPLAD